MQTLVQSCTTTTTKVDTYFGTETTKEKTIHAVPRPSTLNLNQALILLVRLNLRKE